DSWFSGGAYNPYIKISNFATSWIYIDTHVIYISYNPVWEQVFHIPVYDIYENSTLQGFNYNALLKDTLLDSIFLFLNLLSKSFLIDFIKLRN
ncbi:4674_t:CDS:1, partial [Gigaspora rosea]